MAGTSPGREPGRNHGHPCMDIGHQMLPISSYGKRPPKKECLDRSSAKLDRTDPAQPYLGSTSPDLVKAYRTRGPGRRWRCPKVSKYFSKWVITCHYKYIPVTNFIVSCKKILLSLGVPRDFGGSIRAGSVAALVQRNPTAAAGHHAQRFGAGHGNATGHASASSVCDDPCDRRTDGCTGRTDGCWWRRIARVRSTQTLHGTGILTEKRPGVVDWGSMSAQCLPYMECLGYIE